MILLAWHPSYRARLAKFDWIERDTVSQHTSSRASFFSFFPRTSAGGAFGTGKSIETRRNTTGKSEREEKVIEIGVSR